jgi:hypothetical protein
MGDPGHQVLNKFGKSGSWQKQKLYDMITGTPPLPRTGIVRAQSLMRKKRIRLRKIAQSKMKEDIACRERVAAITETKRAAREEMAALKAKVKRTQHLSIMGSTTFERMMRRIQSSDLAASQKQMIRLVRASK